MTRSHGTSSAEGPAAQPRTLDTLIAFKVFALMPGLTASERRVAAAVVDHHNRRSGRCDPGIDRLAALLDLDRSTVIRALNRLHALGLLFRVRHGGRSLRNRYEPRWPRLREIDAAWQNRFLASVANPPSPASQARHLPGREGATQTCLSNLSDEPIREDAVTDKDPRSPSAAAKTKNGLGEKEVFPEPVRKGRHLAAEASAERRWFSELHHRFVGDEVAYGQLIGEISDAVRSAATEAELRRRGTGAATVLRLLGKDFRR